MIRDKNVDPVTGNNFTTQEVFLHGCAALANSQTGTIIAQWKAPWAGKIVMATTCANSVTATITWDLWNSTTGKSMYTGTATPGTMTPVQATTTDETANMTTKAFASGDILQFQYTSNGSGASTRNDMRLIVRPLVGKEIIGL